jgi:hypothetical protein
VRKAANNMRSDNERRLEIQRVLEKSSTAEAGSGLFK